MVDGLCARDVLHHEISCFSILRWQLSAILDFEIEIFSSHALCGCRS